MHAAHETVMGGRWGGVTEHAQYQIPRKIIGTQPISVLFILFLSLISVNSSSHCQRHKRRSSGAMSTRPKDLEIELRHVVIALKDVSGKQWYDLGLQLRLSPSTLDTIAADDQTSDDCKRTMLKKWLQSDPEASWERLAAALTLIGHDTIAANVRAQFVKIAEQVVAEIEQDEIRECSRIGACNYFVSVMR